MNSIDVVATRIELIRFLSGLGWMSDGTTSANFVKGPLGDRRILEFKIGTSYGEVTVHVRHIRETVDVIRIVNESQLDAVKEKINDLACASDRQALS